MELYDVPLANRQWSGGDKGAGGAEIAHFSFETRQALTRDIGLCARCSARYAAAFAYLPVVRALSPGDGKVHKFLSCSLLYPECWIIL